MYFAIDNKYTKMYNTISSRDKELITRKGERRTHGRYGYK